MRANLDKNPHDMKSMFSAMAKHYDLIDFLASLGREEFWCRATCCAIVTRPGIRAFDVTADTGASTTEFVHVGAEVVAVDSS